MKKIILVIVVLFLSAPIVLGKNYKRIVSLAPSVTVSLYELGLESCVKGITSYCPKGFDQKSIIGTLLEPDIEKIISLKPDLIIATKEGNNKSYIEKMEKLGFETYIMEMSENFGAMCDDFYNLSKKLQKEEDGKRVIMLAKDLLERNYKRLNNIQESTIFWEIGSIPLYTAGKQSFFNDFSFHIKTSNIYSYINARYFSVDIEDVLKRNPDIIIFVNMGDVGHEEVDRWRQYKTLKAVKNNRVLLIDIKDIFIPTPLTFAKSVKAVTDIIYGDTLNVQ